MCRSMLAFLGLLSVAFAAPQVRKTIYFMALKAENKNSKPSKIHNIVKPSVLYTVSTILWVNVEQQNLQLHSEQFLLIVVSSDVGSCEILLLLSSQSYLHFYLTLRQSLESYHHAWPSCQIEDVFTISHMLM